MKAYRIVMNFRKSRLNAGMRTSPWIIIGATVILLVIVLVLAVQNIQRDRRHMNEVLSTKGVALIRAVEAGARTGMMGMMWGDAQVQRLLEETARLPEVLYIAIISANDDRVLADSDPNRIGQVLHPDHRTVHVGPPNKENQELITLPNGQRVFEVHRYFRPERPGWLSRNDHMAAMMRRHGMMEGGGRGWLTSGKPDSRLIVVGLDVTPYEKMIAVDIRNTIFQSVVLLLLGFAGFISLFWMNSYRAARRSLQDTSAFADEVVTQLPVGLIATDRDGRIAFFNSAAESLSGVPRRVALGQRTDQILPDPLRRLEKVLERGDSISEREITCTFAHGRTIPMSVSASRIVNEEGMFVGHVLILRDLGELRRLQAEVRRQEKLAAIGGLAAGVAHEIRNPLSSIKGLATYFAAKFTDGSQDRQLAQVMTQEVDRLNRVISELLEFARPTDLKKQPTDINLLLSHSLQLIAQDADAKRILIQRQLSNGHCMAVVDPDRISQCLLNLYLNAIQAMPTGGTLAVTSESVEGSRLRICIEDSGSGIAAEDMDKIFNPYFTTKPKGTGLGLAIVHKIIEAHEGHIQVESTPGKGTRFTLTLACRMEQLGEEQHAESNAAGCG
jgi:two-component system sensor histidine kinase HydH